MRGEVRVETGGWRAGCRADLTGEVVFLEPAVGREFRVPAALLRAIFDAAADAARAALPPTTAADVRPLDPAAPPPGWTPLRVDHLRRADGGRCFYRLGRAGPDGTTVWHGGWRAGVLAVPLREHPLPAAHRDVTVFWQAGDPAAVSVPAAAGWPEYHPDELDGDDGILSADGFTVQIYVPGLKPTGGPVGETAGFTQEGTS